ncbi:MAG TPA: hypothetical protein VFW96_20035 [Thermomicrobiales bacterium]|nr:hypothetical protein [Thermomicrobiales bacterium]
MRQITYAPRFLGRAPAAGDRPGVVRITAFAPSCTVTTPIGPDGVAGAGAPAAVAALTPSGPAGETTATERGTRVLSERRLP